MNASRWRCKLCNSIVYVAREDGQTNCGRCPASRMNSVQLASLDESTVPEACSVCHLPVNRGESNRHVPTGHLTCLECFLGRTGKCGNPRHPGKNVFPIGTLLRGVYLYVTPAGRECRMETPLCYTCFERVKAELPEDESIRGERPTLPTFSPSNTLQRHPRHDMRPEDILFDVRGDAGVGARHVFSPIGWRSVYVNGRNVTWLEVELLTPNGTVRNAVIFNDSVHRTVREAMAARIRGRERWNAGKSRTGMARAQFVVADLGRIGVECTGLNDQGRQVHEVAYPSVPTGGSIIQWASQWHASPLAEQRRAATNEHEHELGPQQRSLL